MSKWNMIVDVARCENCHNCTLSVKDEHVDNDFPGYAAPQPRHGSEWMQIKRKVRGRGHHVDASYLPVMCNHCDDAPCVKAAGDDGSIYKRKDGLTIIDPIKAKGRKELVNSCPYGNIHWNEELSIPQIWIFDAHLLDNGWSQPRASQACPTGALKALKIDDATMQRKAETERLEVLQPELGARPRVYYKNLHQFTKCFLAGTVLTVKPERSDCLEGAEVVLLKQGDELSRSQTDVFGDFKFDEIEPDSGEYTLKISAAGHRSEEVACAIGGESVVVSDVRMTPNLR